MKKISVLLLSFTIFSLAVIAQTNTRYPTGLQTGDAAPEFSAADQYGKRFSLKDALKQGPVVLLFYRGQWCPYCNKQLSHFSDSLQLIKDKGAVLLAITAETAENIRKTIEKTNASFQVIADDRLSIMQAYKVNFQVDEKTIARYKEYGIDFNDANGKNGANLPVPAAYIIGKDGKIRYAFFNTDYRKRASVKDILDNL